MSSLWDDPIAQTLEPVKKEVKIEKEAPLSSPGIPSQEVGYWLNWF